MLFSLLLGAASLPWQGNVSWDDVRASEGCFFFSGPLELGRDDHLGTQAEITLGPRTTVAFGPHVFRGPRGGLLVRESRHDDHGTWDVQETLDGRFDEGGFAGTYLYREREVGKAAWGRCTVTAHVTIR